MEEQKTSVPDQYSDDKKQNTAIDELRKNIVGWKVFVWAMGFIVVFLGLMCSQVVSLAAKVEKTQSEYVTIQTQLSQIQTDLIWIKQELK
jgi:hypothetical protein